MAILKEYFVWILLAITLLATLWVSAQDENAQNENMEQNASAAKSVVSSTRANIQQAARSAQARANNSNLALIKAPSAQSQWGHTQESDDPKNIFTAYVSAAHLAEQTAEVSVAPQMPSLPYAYAGKLNDAGEVMVFLTGAYKNYTVKVGDTIDEIWLVKAISPPMMTLKYLPLNTETTLNIGALL